jgi:nitrite reductase/ring-hydroxylating ferredoxin subunit
MSDTCQRAVLCAAADVEVGKPIRIETGDLTLAVFNLGGEICVTDDACTHGPGSLSEGCVTGDVVECDFHGGAFNIRTGEVVQPPCMVPLKTYRTIVTDGQVSIEF